MRILGVLLCVVLVPAATVRGQELADGPGKDVVMTHCTTCHATDVIVQIRHTKSDWQSVIQTMVSYGAEVPDKDVEIIATYLATYYGKKDEPPPPEQKRPSASDSDQVLRFPLTRAAVRQRKRWESEARTSDQNSDIAVRVPDR